MNLFLNNLQFAYKQPLLQGITTSFRPGELVFLLGANGAGKTTLFKILAGILPQYAGNIMLDGQELRSIPHQQRASLIGFAMQNPLPTMDYTVEEIAMIGRTPKLGLEPTRQDIEAVQAALATLELTDLQHTSANTLSGGEAQRLNIASVLALQPQVMLLDEPFSALDPVQTEYIAGLLKNLSKEHILLLISHDLDLARRYADRVLMLHNGVLFQDTTPQQALTPENIQECFRKK